ncbi:hypothetical protein FS837_005760 [Tulasnella sp. UAMH 9824]|nr:hypothetical protein FS837_005760 [Tulasnella sp. UAMH 9824]
MVPFLCGTLQDLTVCLYVPTEDGRGLIEQAASRTPHLKSLCVELPNELENSLVWWLSKSPLLESVSLPRDYQTTAIVEALGDLGYLTRLKLHYGVWHSKEETTDQCFSFNSPSGFSRLEALEIDAPTDRLVQLFQTSERFSQVKQIALSSKDPAPEQVFNLTAAVAQRCPGIASIILELGYSDDGEENLEVFKIDTTKPFSISEQDLMDMALAWPGIQELSLSPRPDEDYNLGGFPLRLLPIAAGRFSSLQILRIYVDPEGNTPEFDYNTPPSSKFQSLRVLDVGTSSVLADPCINLGLIIGSLCKLEVRIEGVFESVETNPHK